MAGTAAIAADAVMTAIQRRGVWLTVGSFGEWLCQQVMT